MERKHNTDKQGNDWTERTKILVWSKGDVVPKHRAHIWRQDKCGKVMTWSEHGDRDAKHGWEIDHIVPVSSKGADEIENLQPLHWSSNDDKGEKLNWQCPSDRHETSK